MRFPRFGLKNRRFLMARALIIFRGTAGNSGDFGSGSFIYEEMKLAINLPASWQQLIVSASALSLGALLFYTAPGEEASGSGQKCRCFLLHAWRWAEPPARLSQKTKKHTNQNKTPGHLSISAFRSASLRFTPTTTTYGHRVPSELRPTGPVVFCGSASHSLPLFVCNMIRVNDL